MKTSWQYHPACRAAAVFALLFLLAGCDRGKRELREGPQAQLDPPPSTMVDLQPGMPAPRPEVTNPYAGNFHAISEGERLYRWFNCIGCHAAGGGGMGPALIDDKWIYGSEPADIYKTIMEGRPEGMPAFRGRISESDAWKIVTYIRSLSGLEPKPPKGATSLPLQDKASDNIDKGPKELKEYYKEAMDD